MSSLHTNTFFIPWKVLKSVFRAQHLVGDRYSKLKSHSLILWLYIATIIHGWKSHSVPLENHWIRQSVMGEVSHKVTNPNRERITRFSVLRRVLMPFRRWHWFYEQSCFVFQWQGFDKPNSWQNEQLSDDHSGTSSRWRSRLSGEIRRKRWYWTYIYQVDTDTAPNEYQCCSVSPGFINKQFGSTVL